MQDGLTGDVLVTLWASCQFYRNDQGQVGFAQGLLVDVGVHRLDYGMCCWKAAEVLEALRKADDGKSSLENPDGKFLLEGIE